MTNYKQAQTNGRRGDNIKDGKRGALNRQRDYNGQLEAEGFTRTDWNKWTYTWDGDFPAFTLAPGIVDGKAGLVARCAEAGVEILLPYGTPPDNIKARLNDEIDEIMGLQADVVDPLPAEAYIPFLGEPYRAIIIEGEEIGPEIPF